MALLQTQHFFFKNTLMVIGLITKPGLNLSPKFLTLQQNLHLFNLSFTLVYKIQNIALPTSLYPTAINRDSYTDSYNIAHNLAINK